MEHRKILIELNTDIENGDQEGFIRELYSMYINDTKLKRKVDYITAGKGLPFIHKFENFSFETIISNKEVLTLLDLLDINCEMEEPTPVEINMGIKYNPYHIFQFKRMGGVDKLPVFLLDAEFHVDYYKTDNIVLYQVYKIDNKKEELRSNLAILKTIIIGQDRVLEDVLLYISYILELKKLAAQSTLIKPPIQTIFLQGLTGHGKTFILESIAKLLKFDVVTFDTSRLTAEGYVGLSVEDILYAIYIKQSSQKDPQTPIVVLLDEMDKIAETPETRNDVGTSGAQRNLLKLLETESGVVTADSKYNKEEIDLKNVIFMFAGAFSKYKEEKSSEKVNIGFSRPLKEQVIENENFQMTTEDLIKAGIMPELAGRIGRVITLNKLQRHHYKTILCTSANNFLAHNKLVLSELGVDVELTNEEIEKILDETEALKLGVRGLNTITSKFFIDKAKKEIYN